MLLKDKVVIVSGIGPGLGNQLALAAAREGAKVVLSARGSEKLDAAEDAIRAAGFKVDVLKQTTDITDAARCQELAAATLRTFGRIDLLINSAFTSGRLQPMDDTDLDDWRAIMETNLYGSMQMTSAVVPQMKRQGGGSIVMINTLATRTPAPLQGGYAVSKGALKTAASYLARELGQYRIRVNSVFMGWMWGVPVKVALEKFAAAQGISPLALKKEVEAFIPLGKMPTDTECADAVIMLGSDLARAVTGACLDVNGGHYLP